MNPQLLNKPICLAKADSGASNHFWKVEDATALVNQHIEEGPPVKLPNSTTINDNKVGYLPSQDILSTKAKKVRILSDLKSSNLISLGQLADDGCKTTILQNDLYVEKNGKTIMHGIRNWTDDLYDIPIYLAHPNPKTSITSNNFRFPKIHTLPFVVKGNKPKQLRK